MKKLYAYILGLTAGILNGFFGSGGGIIVVPMLKKLNIPTKKSHATSVAIILPMCVISAVIYLLAGARINIISTLILIICGLLGTLLGTFLLKKTPNIVLKRLFSLIMIYSGIRILLK